MAPRAAAFFQSFDKLDYSKVTEHLNTQKMVKKAITDAERLHNKHEKDSLNFKHGYAIVDGHLEKVGNYNMEPPGTFRGRGEHPKMGKIKQVSARLRCFFGFANVQKACRQNAQSTSCFNPSLLINA